MNRTMSVAGTFYPASCEEIKSYIKKFDKILSVHDIEIEKKDVKAVIVPHAGYVYSGFTANMAYKSVKDDKKRVIVIGPSHKIYLEGMSISMYDEIETPCGNLKVDKEYAKKIFDTYPFATFIKDAHHEHSTETQFPFIKYYFKDIEVVEIVYGKIDYKLLSLAVDEILKDKDNLLVVSTDLSHFYPLSKAKELDNICLNAIIKKDLKLFDKGCEACGLTGVKALIMTAQKSDMKVKFLDYRTSYDMTKDDQSVVGYSSFLFYR